MAAEMPFNRLEFTFDIFVDGGVGVSFLGKEGLNSLGAQIFRHSPAYAAADHHTAPVEGLHYPSMIVAPFVIGVMVAVTITISGFRPVVNMMASVMRKSVFKYLPGFHFAVFDFVEDETGAVPKIMII